MNRGKPAPDKCFVFMFNRFGIGDEIFDQFWCGRLFFRAGLHVRNHLQTYFNRNCLVLATSLDFCKQYMRARLKGIMIFFNTLIEPEGVYA